MSMWYFVDGVLILNDSVCPTLTLIDVAKPWIVASPAPLTCQSLAGSPGCVFSQAITLVTGGPQGLAAPAGEELNSEAMPRTSTAAAKPTTKRRPGDRRASLCLPGISFPPVHDAQLLLSATTSVRSRRERSNKLM